MCNSKNIGMKWNKRGAAEFVTRNLVYYILIAACIVIMWFIVKGIINKLLTLY